MCGRIGLPQLTYAQFVAWERGELDWDEVYREDDKAFTPQSWNVKPTQTVEIVFREEQRLVSSTARWWFVPNWYQDDVKAWKQTTFNARIETAFEKPTFRTAWTKNRCLIPATGYYEWSGQKQAKQPWWLTTQRNEPFYFFAGMYSRLETTNTCTILTRAADPGVEHIHHRMPVILTQNEIAPWLMGRDDVVETLGIAAGKRLKAHQVHKFGRDDDDASLIEPMSLLL